MTRIGLDRGVALVLRELRRFLEVLTWLEYAMSTKHVK